MRAIFGGASIGNALKGAYNNEATLNDLYKALQESGVDTIDTARLYGDSEKQIGDTHGGDKFTIDTKTPGGFIAGESTGANILKHAKESTETLNVKKVDVFYIHSPDPSLDLEDMLKGVNDAYQAGYFKRFGVSNFKASDVERIYNLCKEKGYPLPAVYQGNYSAVARRQETELFPTLRKLNIAFYAYSPIAGGFLTKTRDQIENPTEEGSGRFHSTNPAGGLYNGLYNKPSYLKALDLWEETAKSAGYSKPELAFRWVSSQLDESKGDAIIFGSSKLPQIKETARWVKEGLPNKDAVAKIDEIWKVIEKDAPLDNYNQ